MKALNALWKCAVLPVLAIIFMGGGIVTDKCLYGEGAEFLIITHGDYYAHACSLAAWKYSKGIPTEVTKLTEINPTGTPTKEEIKAYIINAAGDSSCYKH